MKAAEAIKSHKQTIDPAPLSEAARKELKQLLEHNDRQTNPAEKVGRRLALQVLASNGWKGSALLLDRLCVTEFKRKSYAKR